MKCKFNESNRERIQAVIPAAKVALTHINAFEPEKPSYDASDIIEHFPGGPERQKHYLGIINLIPAHHIGDCFNMCICSVFLYDLNDNLILLSSQQLPRMSIPFFKRCNPHFGMK